MKETKKTKLTLLSWTQNPLETVYAQWLQSRTTGPVPCPDQIKVDRYNETCRIADKVLGGEMKAQFAPISEMEEAMAYAKANPGKLTQAVLAAFDEVLAMDMPIGQTIYFTFLIENMPITLREQAVRHKIGHKFGDQLGADTLPDLADSTFWSQTMRTQVMDRFASDGDYCTPEWLTENGDKPMESTSHFVRDDLMKARQLIDAAHGDGAFDRECPQLATLQPFGVAQNTVAEFYHTQFGWIQSAYNRLVKAGMPVEDARNLLPVGLQHRMTWTLNFSSLKALLSKRGCWIAQLGIWRPVIEGMVNELATRIHPTFRRLIDPPCIGKNGRYNACPFDKENVHLVHNTDLPPCPLWLNLDTTSMKEPGWALNKPEFERTAVGEARWPKYMKRMDEFADLWARNPRTGERIKVG